VGENGKANLSPRLTVTAKVVGHVRGEKIRIGKYRPKTGYRRHTGFRAALSQIEIESIGARSTRAKGEAAGAKAAPTAKKPAAAKKPPEKPDAKQTTTRKPAERTKKEK
jgi:large subunit ribosomal protein L21